MSEVVMTMSRETQVQDGAHHLQPYRAPIVFVPDKAPTTTFNHHTYVAWSALQAASPLVVSPEPNGLNAAHLVARPVLERYS